MSFNIKYKTENNLRVAIDRKNLDPPYYTLYNFYFSIFLYILLYIIDIL